MRSSNSNISVAVPESFSYALNVFISKPRKKRYLDSILLNLAVWAEEENDLLGKDALTKAFKEDPLLISSELDIANNQ